MRLSLEQKQIYSYDLALKYYEKKEFDSVIKTLEKLPLTVVTANLLGCCYEELMNFAEAEIAFKQAIEIDPNDTAPLH